MAEETIITNVGEDDVSSVASEATLLQLLSAMKDMAKKTGKDPASAEAKAKKLAEKAAQEAARDNTEAKEENTKTTKKATEAKRNYTKVLSGLSAFLASSVINSLSGFTRELLEGGDQLSDFSKHIPVVGSVITPFVQFIESTVDNFRSLSSVGAAFGNSLEDLRRSAATARLPLDEFSSLIQNNSERMIFLGSTVSDGARRFAEIAGELRGDDGLFGALKAMGFTTEEVNEGLANYINLQGRLGRLQGRTNAELAAGAAEYLHQLDRLSKVTGRQRQEIERDLERINLDAGIRTLQNNLEQIFGPESQEVRNFRESLGLISSLPEAYQDAARSMLLGLPTEEAARLMALGGEDLNQALQAVAQGADPSVLQEAFLATFENLRENIDAIGDPRDAALFIEGLRRVDPVLAGFYDNMFDLDRLGEANLAAARAEQYQRDRIIENLTRFDDRIREIRATIQEALIDSGVFELVATSVSDLAGLINGPEGMAAIRNGIDSMVSFFRGFIDDVTEMGFMGAIKNAFVDLAMNIWEEIRLRLFGGTRDTSDQQESIDARIQDLERRRRSLGPEDGLRGGEERSRERAAIDAQLEQLRSRRESLIDQHGDEVEGILPGFLSQLFSLESALVAGGVIAGLVLLGGALSAAGAKSPMILAGGAAIGAAIAAIGAGIAGATILIGISLPSLADGLKLFEDIDGEALRDAASGMAAISVALVALGGGQVISGIGSFVDGVLGFVGRLFGAEDPLDKLRRFGDAPINAEGVEANAAAMVAMSRALAAGVGLTSVGAIESFVDGVVGFVGRLFGAEDPLDKLRRFGDAPINAEGVEANAAALISFTNALVTVSDSNLSRIRLPDDRFMRQLSAFEEISGSNLIEIAEGLQAMSNVTDFSDQMSSLTDDLDINSLRNFNNELQRLLEILNSINEEMSRDTRRRNFIGQRVGEIENPAAEMLSGVGTGSSSGTETRLDRLNTTMVELLRVAQEQLDVLGDIEDNTDGISGDISRRGITSFGR